jgi:hypothetical protein
LRGYANFPIIDQHFPDDDALDAVLPAVAPALHTQQEPWRALRRINARVERLLSRHEQEAEEHQRQETRVQAALASLSSAELLAGANRDNYRYTARALQQRIAAGDHDILLHAAAQGDRWQRVAAFRGLRRLAHPAALPILRTYFETAVDEPTLVYRAAIKAMTALPPALTLDLARVWFDTGADTQQYVSRSILTAHGTRADVLRARTALVSSLRTGSDGWQDYYLMCDMLELLARFPDAGPYPEVEIAFREARYSRARSYAATVLAASERTRFAGGLAVECLWDCEGQARQTGCACVDLQDLHAYDRLQALARDPLEDEEVQEAARKRLGQESTPPRSRA